MDIDKDALKAEQRDLAARVEVPTDPGEGHTPTRGDLVLAMDIQYSGDAAHVSGDLHRLGGEHLGTWAGVTPATFPYVPGYFCFREGPPLQALIEALAREGLPRPDLMIIDGHGIAHPRRFGVASWLGIVAGVPAIGCAKETLVRYDRRPEPLRGLWTPVELNGEAVGAVLCHQDGIKPIYVSPGHRISLQSAIDAVMMLGGEYRVPDPIRRADFAARAHSRGEAPSEWLDLGEI